MDLQLGYVDAASVAAKTVLYLATFGAGGGVLFLLLFGGQLSAAERVRIERGIALAASGAVLLTLLRFFLVVVALGGGVSSLSDAELVGFVLQTGEGHSALLRIAGLVLIVLGRRRNTFGLAAAAIGACAAVASFALTGHTLSAEAGLTARLLLTVHLFAVAYWLGAFVPLRIVTSSEEIPRVARIMKRFGAVATYVVAALLIAGAALLWILLGSPIAVFDSAYGRLLAFKIVAVAALLGFAAANKSRFTPRLIAGDVRAVAALRRSILLEIAVAALILTITAVFTTVTGPPGGS
jgi:putative copper export protein